VLAIVYSYVIVYVPLVGYVSVIFLGGLIVGIGSLVFGLGRATKCRNPNFLRLVGFACGLLAFYFSWAAFEYVLLDRFDRGMERTMVDAFLSPTAVWHVALDINRTGWYSIFGGTPSGTLLWIMWAVEAVLIILGPPILVSMLMDDEVFCEHCNAWCEKSLDAARLAPPDDQDDLQQLRFKNLDLLKTLRPAERDTYPSLRIDMWNCDLCKQTAAVRTRLYTVETNRIDPAEVAQNLTPIFLVNPATLTSIGNG
jgi:hypothetical protein